MMKLMILMMKMIPGFVKRMMTAPMLKKERLITGRNHPTIKMNLENLLICAEYCGTCPSNPGEKGEALYCASGKSIGEIIEEGCNCITCPLYDKCSSANTAYFCKNGSCVSLEKGNGIGALFIAEADKYIKRFMGQIENRDEAEKEIYSKDTQTEIEKNIKDVQIDFTGDRIVDTKSNIPLLHASLDAGINHTHVCGGNARCSTCRVVVTDGLENCRPRNEKETELAKIKGFSPEIRLACQTTIHDKITVRRLVLDEGDISDAINQGRGESGEIGREVEAAILFSDIRSFTAFSENSLPYDVIHILNRYFETMGTIISKNGGYIDKYMGDGIMAIFGLDPEFTDHPAHLATTTALQMIDVLKEFNVFLKSHFNHEFRIGIGVHTGNVIIGTLGYHQKKEYTAIGDTVNTASRIESLNKRAGTCVLISETTYNIAKDKFSFKKKYTSKVKGKENAITVYEPVLKDHQCEKM